MIDIHDIELPSKHIAFTFVEHVNTQGLFQDSHDGAIAVVTQGHHYESANKPRFVDVIKCSSDIVGVSPGDRLLVAPLRWSFGIVDGDRKFHVTTIDDVLAILEE